MKRKIIAYMATAFSLTALLSGCGNSNVDTTTSATAELPLAEDVSVRVGTDPEGEALLDGTTIRDHGQRSLRHWNQQSLMPMPSF